MWVLALAGCSLNLDPFGFNPVHCSTVDAQTCDRGEWDSVCLSCDEAYDWGLEYPWFDTMLEPGQSVREPTVVERHTIPSEDGLAELDAYWVPSHGEDGALASVTLLYNHGNYAGVEHYIPRVRLLHELGYNVLIWDYRGYGKSLPDTIPTAQEFVADARTVRAFVDGLAPDPERIVSYGYSLGAIPAMEAAVDDPTCAVLLEAPFTSAASITEQNTGLRWPETYFSEGAFDNVRKAGEFPNALLGMVGTEDPRFPPAGVQEIVDAAAGPSEIWILEGVGHGISDGGIPEAGLNAYGDRMRAFLIEHACAEDP